MYRQLEQGKLEQTCPKCHIWEAAHFYCTNCLKLTGPADWYLNHDQREREARGAVTDNTENRVNKSGQGQTRPRGRPKVK